MYTHLLPALEGIIQDIADKIIRISVVVCLQALIAMLKSILLKSFSIIELGILLLSHC